MIEGCDESPEEDNVNILGDLIETSTNNAVYMYTSVIKKEKKKRPSCAINLPLYYLIAQSIHKI